MKILQTFNQFTAILINTLKTTFYGQRHLSFKITTKINFIQIAKF